MNRNVKIAKASFPFTSGGFSKRASRGILGLMSVVCLLLASTSARAACGSFGALHVKGAVKLPMLGGANPDLSADTGANQSTIVGLWHVIYTNNADGTTFNDTLDTWHADGTEFESAFLPPAGGNVCVGVWKQNGAGTVSLHHIGWLFDPANPTGTATNYFTLDEVVAVASDGATYSGTFEFKVWNLDGTPTPAVVTGKIAATRITVN